MGHSKIEKSTLQFLKELSNNNNRPWFTDNKGRYQAALENVKTFVSELEALMNKHDMIEKSKLFRIYRDVRFSKDKSPYKSHFAFSFTRATARLRGGCFVSVGPGNTHVAGGFWAPNAPDLKRIRKEFEHDDKEIRSIIADPTFVKYFGTLEGEGVKTAPKGFDKEHPAIDLIKKKQFIINRSFTDKEMLSDNFIEEVDKTFQAMRPFFDYMSIVLTTDENGVSLLED